MIKKNQPTVYLGSDHAAFKLKESLHKYLTKIGYKVIDVGAFSDSPSDYPDYIIPTTEAAVTKKTVAIVMGKTGIGECIAANKVHGARAALVYDIYTARLSREHNNANVLCLGSQTTTKDFSLTKRIVKAWLQTTFSKAIRHKRRLKKIQNYEKGRY
ncbi:RpiB/LacA/LacB family sugar-phosphate isomerase [Patescibacteria group bacterium]|nr:RpiB/LacA/LacB family sugar-phosphate isomerase [Patescibacteria group bacterium]MBU1029148.1 RpiB/LacA/LacB family sugar-phosphate isomerase [Patescibacteria group bacterium]MBU1916392.1 RpiB/LacA/LacB family sugar-phosphate isomerase [Patescibacteria group bacterium]